MSVKGSTGRTWESNLEVIREEAHDRGCSRCARRFPGFRRVSQQGSRIAIQRTSTVYPPADGLSGPGGGDPIWPSERRARYSPARVRKGVPAVRGIHVGRNAGAAGAVLHGSTWSNGMSAYGATAPRA